MNRRTVLKWLSRLLASVSASVVVVPGVGFVLAPLRRSQNQSVVQRIARLNDLPVGKPVLCPIVGSHRDAWSVHSEEVIGRVWLIRQTSSADSSPEATSVAAFTSLCPHLGCAIQHDPRAGHFICPCHRAAFGQNGEPLGERDLGRKNHAPRGMDALECQVVQDAASNEWWIEVKYEKFEQGLTHKVPKA